MPLTFEQQTQQTRGPKVQKRELLGVLRYLHWHIHPQTAEFALLPLDFRVVRAIGRDQSCYIWSSGRRT